MSNSDLKSIWCVIPVYNNGGTIKEVAVACRAILPNILVVDDGSTDVDIRELLADTDITVIRHGVNQGKGGALLTALDFTSNKDARYMITIDGDGQHRPSDLHKVIPLLQDDDTLWIGVRDFSQPNIPQKSKFGRDFANFWLKLETGVSIHDCQSGFRAYPVRHFKKLGLAGKFYDFETEALARAAWAGLSLKMMDIDVWYPEEGTRISSFRPFMDNWRISMMHSRLVMRHLLPIPHKKLVRAKEKAWNLNFFRHPLRFMKMLLIENATPGGLAASAAVGIILATLPLHFVHTITIIYVTTRLHLNKIMAVSIQNLCNPPFVPFICIEIGYFIRNGTWLTHISKEAFLGQIPSLLWDWLIGSLIVAPILAAVVGGCVFFISKYVQKSKTISLSVENQS